MKPSELTVYDNYPVWFTHLADVCAAVQALPLDEMLAVNVRIDLTGGLIGPGTTEQADPAAMARQRELIEKAITFRESLRPAQPAS
jgi:hypothetical protein